VLENWNVLSDDVQLLLSRQALRLAAGIISNKAEMIADEIESGGLLDRGGPDALRLLAAVVREMTAEEAGPVGHA
jgi:hypothetical protein